MWRTAFGLENEATKERFRRQLQGLGTSLSWGPFSTPKMGGFEGTSPQPFCKGIFYFPFYKHQTMEAYQTFYDTLKHSSMLNSTNNHH